MLHSGRDSEQSDLSDHNSVHDSVHSSDHSSSNSSPPANDGSSPTTALTTTHVNSGITVKDGDSSSRKKDNVSKLGTTQARVNASTRSKQRAKAVRKEVGLVAPDKPPAPRSRRRPDEIYEDWEKADGVCAVAYPKSLEPVADLSPAIFMSGKS
jgi:hypothetical protein